MLTWKSSTHCLALFIIHVYPPSLLLLPTRFSSASCGLLRPSHSLLRVPFTLAPASPLPATSFVSELCWNALRVSYRPTLRVVCMNRWVCCKIECYCLLVLGV
ncbi:hypothetical protein RIF29_34843 [Crotalaria pallida]|uniref:Secreted protein n=1 Tax=Crotalaria pallida TaxID=3830 RepID=A0AAN9EBZ2_CROPI